MYFQNWRCCKINISTVKNQLNTFKQPFWINKNVLVTLEVGDEVPWCRDDWHPCRSTRHSSHYCRTFGTGSPSASCRHHLAPSSPYRWWLWAGRRQIEAIGLLNMSINVSVNLNWSNWRTNNNNIYLFISHLIIDGKKNQSYHWETWMECHSMIAI